MQRKSSDRALLDSFTEQLCRATSGKNSVE
jgi:hypothetical protein